MYKRSFAPGGRKFNHLLAFVLIVGLVLTTAYLISAQQEDGRRQRPQRQQRRDPAEMMKQAVDRIMQGLNPSEEETATLKPKIEGIAQMYLKQRNERRTLMRDLQRAVEAKDDAQIKEKLRLVKAKRKEHKTKIETLEKELVGLLSVKQEAILTVATIVNGDGSGLFGGFGGRRGQRDAQGRRGGRDGGSRGGMRGGR